MLTRRQAEEAVAQKTDKAKIIWCNRPVGFGLRLRSSGSASWVFRYRPRGAPAGTPPRTLTIGSYSSIPIEDARVIALGAASQVASGGDPANAHREAKIRERRGLASALDAYNASLKQRHIVNRETILSTLRRGLQSYLGREIDELSRADFIARIEAWENDGRPGAAHDLRAKTHTFLSWAVDQGLLRSNVLAGFRRRHSRAEKLAKESRQKALGDAEIIAVWNAASDIPSFGNLVRLALLSGCRLGELTSLRWSDVHEDRIVIRASIAKTGQKHEVHLTDLMRRVLERQHRTTSELVFPSTRTNGELAGLTGLRDRLARTSGIEFSMHDTRRTVRTLLSRLGVDEHIAELCIGHRRPNLISIYNKDDAWQRRAEAFKKLSAHVEGLIG